MRNKPSGKFLPKDESGYLENDTSINKIAPEFGPLIANVKETVIDVLGECLHSIYLTGSIPRGMAQIFTSDLDLFAVLNPNCTDSLLPSVKTKCDKLLSKNKTVSKIDIEFWHFEKVFPAAPGLEKINVTNTLSVFDVILKNSSLCIYGDNLGQYIPKIKPGVALSNDELIVIHDDIRQAKEAILAADNKAKIGYWCKRVMKNIIRAGFCLCMPIIQEQTRDIDLCAKVFSKYYPDMVHITKQAIIWTQNPSSNSAEIIDFLDNDGALFLTKVDCWMEKYNPKRKQELSRNL